MQDAMQGAAVRGWEWDTTESHHTGYLTPAGLDLVTAAIFFTFFRSAREWYHWIVIG
jgi:hypothetical protein